MRATSLREGAFSRRLMVGWEQRSRPLSGARPTASLKRGSPRRASQSSASSYPQAIANMRKRSIAGSVWTTRSGSRHSRMQPASVSDRPSRRSAPRNRTSPAVGRDQPAREIGGHLLAACGWKIERERSIFGHGGRGALVVSGEMRLATNFYPISTGYAMSAITSSHRKVESRTGAPALGSGGLSGAFAPGLSPAPMAAFPVPAHQTGRAGFPHPAFGRDHAFACGRPLVLGDRRVRP